MNGNKTYRITEGDYTPSGKWNEYPHLMDYRHCANVMAQKYRDADAEEFKRLMNSSFTIWSTMLEAVNIYGDRVYYDVDLEPAEGKYIAVAIQNAIRDRKAHAE